MADPENGKDFLSKFRDEGWRYKQNREEIKF